MGRARHSILSRHRVQLLTLAHHPGRLRGRRGGSREREHVVRTSMFARMSELRAPVRPIYGPELPSIHNQGYLFRNIIELFIKFDGCLCPNPGQLTLYRTNDAPLPPRPSQASHRLPRRLDGSCFA